MQLDKLSAYSARWGLQISLVKTKVLQLSGAGADTTQRPDVMVNGTVLPWVDCFTYLGVPFYETKEMDSLMAEERIMKGRRAQAAAIDTLGS